MHAVLRVARYLFLVGFILLFSSGIFFTIVVINDNSFFDSLNELLLVNEVLTEKEIINFMDWIYNNCNQSITKEKVPFYVIAEGLAPLRYSARSIIDYACYVEGYPYHGTCGSMTRVALVLLRRRGIPVRKLQLELDKGSHTMPVVLVNGKWRVFDVSHNFHWVNNQGEIATLVEIQADEDLFAQIKQQWPRYKYHFSKTTYIRWKKMGRFGEFLVSLLEKVFGKEYVAEIDTPPIYERPKLFYAGSSYVVCLFFLFIYIILGRTIKTRKNEDINVKP